MLIKVIILIVENKINCLDYILGNFYEDKLNMFKIRTDQGKIFVL